MDTEDAQSEVGDLSVRDLVTGLVAGRWVILASAIVMAIIGAVVSSLMQPIYAASVVMIPASERNDLGASLGASIGALSGLAAVAGVNLASTSTETEEAIAVLKSREFSDHFISDLKLATRFFEKEWDAATSTWRRSSKGPTASQAFRYFDRNVRTIVQDRRSSLVTLRIHWKDPIEAAQWANELVRRLNAEMRLSAIEAANKSIVYLERELAKAAVLEARNAVSRLIEAQMNRRMLATVSDEFAFRVIDKAVPSDVDDVVRPKKAVIVIFAALLGAMGAATLIIMARAIRRAAR